MAGWGKDGSFYKDDNELRRADNKWLQQQEQNRLIDEQNRLIKKEMEEQNNLIMAERNKRERERERAEWEKFERTVEKEREQIRNQKKKEIYEDYYNLKETIEYSKDYFTHQYGKDSKLDEMYEAQFGTFEKWLNDYKKLEILKQKADLEWNVYFEESQLGKDYYKEDYFDWLNAISKPKLTDGLGAIIVSFILFELVFAPIAFISASEPQLGIIPIAIGAIFAVIILLIIMGNMLKLSAFKQEAKKKKIKWKKDKEEHDKRKQEIEKERLALDKKLQEVDKELNKPKES